LHNLKCSDRALLGLARILLFMFMSAAHRLWGRYFNRTGRPDGQAVGNEDIFRSNILLPWRRASSKRRVEAGVREA
jgi:hypothetical protein